MAKLYPPYIEGTIPAFYKNDEGTGTLTVPFSMNKAVNKSEVIGFQAIVKTVQNNKLILTLSTTSYDIENEYKIYFDLSVTELKSLNIGQFYKVQVAYKSLSGEIGYYSTVGVVKYTTKPIVTIENLILDNLNMHRYYYVGKYSQMTYTYVPISNMTFEMYEPNKYYVKTNNIYVLATTEIKEDDIIYYQRNAILDINNNQYKDTTEKEYSYRFVLYNKVKEIVLDTGYLLHNSSEDLNSYESSDSYAFPSDLDEGETYYIQYIVKTNNNMIVESPQYRLIQKTAITPEIHTEVVASLNAVNGYIDVSLVGTTDANGAEYATTGAFLLTRACSDDNYKVWNEVFRFVLHGQHPSRWLWRDFTIEQGKTYVYSLQQYNDAGLYSARILSNSVEADFEDIFLYDGTYQLKIKYNPKVSSFKTDLLETKIETIGSKYPFIFRNGNVAYKEFPINGLISYQSDEENLFITDEELGFSTEINKLTRAATIKREITSKDSDFFNDLQFKTSVVSKGLYDEIVNNYEIQDRHTALLINNKTRTTNLTHYNIAAERLFKLKVLDWLNNGEPKLFRSPTEGNYLVRLMNISLSPEEQLGRMLHSFSATAYEIAECSYDNLNDYGIITIDTPINKQLRWQSLMLATTEDKSNDSRYKKIGGRYYLRGEILHGYHAAATSVQFTDMTPGSLIYINVPVAYQNTDNAILNQYSYLIGTTGSYTLNADAGIESIMLPTDAMYEGIVTYSYYNDAHNIFNEIEDVDIIDVPCKQFIGAYDNIINNLENIKNHLIRFYYLHFALRYCATAYWDPVSKQLYRYANYTNPISDVPIDPARCLPGGLSAVASSYYEDPLMLYKYQCDYLILNNRKIMALKPYDKIEPIPAMRYDTKKTYYRKLNTGKFQRVITTVTPTNYSNYYYLEDYLDELFKSTNPRYFYTQYSTTPVSEYDPNITQYYTISPFTVYYDPYDIDTIILDPSDMERVNDVIQHYNMNVKNIKEYNTNIYINGNSLDLSEIGSYTINKPIDLNQVGQDCGIALECGYEMQELVYSLENSVLSVKQKKALYNKYKQYFSSDTLQAYLNSNNEEDYVELLEDARNNIHSCYDDFIAELNIAKEQWEAENRFNE